MILWTHRLSSSVQEQDTEPMRLPQAESSHGPTSPEHGPRMAPLWPNCGPRKGGLDPKPARAWFPPRSAGLSHALVGRVDACGRLVGRDSTIARDLWTLAVERPCCYGAVRPRCGRRASYARRYADTAARSSGVHCAARRRDRAASLRAHRKHRVLSRCTGSRYRPHLVQRPYFLWFRWRIW